MNPFGLACRSVFCRVGYDEERGKGDVGGDGRKVRTVEHENFERSGVGFGKVCHCS